jgi:alkylresorcinol/alkylpyrone synthase
VRARLQSLSTAVPPHVLETADVMREVVSVFAQRRIDFEYMLPVFGNTGIEQRYSVRPYDWFRGDKGWPERTDAFVEGATALFRDCAVAALAEADVDAAQIDTIVTVSSTGIATPTIEARMMHELGFRDDVKRVPVFGLGCAGGMSGLSLAARLAQASPGSKVLIVVIELCTLAFRPDEMTKSNIVATALFGDGAAAAVLSTAGRSLGEIEFAGEHTWPASTDVMGWRMDPQGFGAIFSRSIPDLTARDLKPAADLFMARHGLSFADVDGYSFHPGGAKVITALEMAFGLEQGQLQVERDILARYGNMSAVTVLFVLHKALEQAFSGRRFLSALGPGFTASFITMLQ